MSDLQKIVGLCILGLVLIGVFFYALSSIQEGEVREINDDAVPTNERATDTDATPEERVNDQERAPATNTPTSTGPTYEPGLPTSSDAGMEFPILENN